MIKDRERIANLAENVRRKMIRENISQSELAEATGIPQTSISRLLRCENDPAVSVVCRLADYFETSVDRLLETPAKAAKEKSAVPA